MLTERGENIMKILLVNPKYPDTFWSFKYALKFISRKSAFPPLGLLTVASMLPDEWEKKAVDMNATRLRDKDIARADCVFISAMGVQRESAKKVATRCKALGTKTVAGGPLFAAEHMDDDFKDIDHFVLGEAENSLAPFLRDLGKGQAKRVYPDRGKADMADTPLPSWQLVKKGHYDTMSIQYSRGCPFDCEFCDITSLYGRIPRTKSKDQVIAELDALYDWGWRGGVFFVDDNFIGNAPKLKKEILPAITGWMEEKGYPFTFLTEASINLSDDEKLMDMMSRAGFYKVFIGIETPDEASLGECNKVQNKGRDLVECVKKIQNHGMEVQGGFIVGFDSDTHSIFEKQIEFIQKSGIVTAMVGLLGAIRGTNLYRRLKEEGRIIGNADGNNTDYSLNFIPKMDPKALVEGYKKILSTIYSPKEYYKRIITFLKEYRPAKLKVHPGRFRISYITAFFKSVWVFGIKSRGRRYFWKLIFWCLSKNPALLSKAITFSVYRYHFQNIFGLK